ncbi:ORC-CDC6 family AAA ATPase [Mycolicibacter minnesotensis]
MEPATPFDTFNAKKMSAIEVAKSFVVPSYFTTLAGKDHCYIAGPRGSGKTTLLRMLQGETLMGWTGEQASSIRRQIDYSTIFLPTDELWASQTSEASATAAFTAQILYAFTETLIYRRSKIDRYGNPVHLPVSLSHDKEVDFCSQCIKAWGLESANPSIVGLQKELDLYLARVSSGLTDGSSIIERSPALSLISFGIRAFNRTVSQPDHQWALLLDEMELAPTKIHRDVVSFVRGGTANLILKISMSPFDRYVHSFGVEGGPIPGHDFQTIYLFGQNSRDIRVLTNGLWAESLRARGLPHVPLSKALGTEREPLQSLRNHPTPYSDVPGFFRYVQTRDRGFAAWLRRRHIDVEALDQLSYNDRSATVRKVLPLLVFRDALLNYRDGNVARRSRKKSLEPFTGAGAVTRALEGNPRWIKVAFAHMLNYYDIRTRTINQGFQFDALTELANRFESLLRVLPRRNLKQQTLSVPDLVNKIAAYMNQQNLGTFAPDPQNCFTVDAALPAEVFDALIMGLYAGAFVHVRNRKSPAVLSELSGERFRLAYLLGVRDGREFPLRLGKDVSLYEILQTKSTKKAVQPSDQLGLDI